MRRTLRRCVACICAGIMLVIPFFTLSVGAVDDSIESIVYSDITQKVTVSGRFAGYPNKNVVMTVLRWGESNYTLSDLTKTNAKDIIYTVKQIKTNTNGNYETTFTINESDTANRFKIYISGDGMQTGEYVTEEYILETIGTKLSSGELSGVDIGEFKSGLGIADVSATNYGDVALKMIADKARYSDIIELAGKSAAVVELDGTANTADILKRYKKVLGIEDELAQFDYLVDYQQSIIDAVEAVTYTYAEEISAQFKELISQAAEGKRISIAASYNYETKEIEVTGAVQNEDKRIVMTILKPRSESQQYSLNDLNIANAKNIIFAVKQGKTKTDGTFAFKVGVPGSPIGGDYVVIVSCEGMNIPESMRKKVLYVSTATERINAVSSVNNATISNIGSAIKHKALDIDYNEKAYTKNEASVNAYIISIRDGENGFSSGDVDKVRDVFYAAEIAAGAKNKNLTKAELLEIGNRLGICKEAEFTANADAIISLMQDNVSDEIDTIDEVKALYKKSLALAEVNSVGRESLSAKIQKYATELGISGKTKYQTYVANPESQLTWNVQLAHKNFRNTDDFWTAFDAAVPTTVTSGNNGLGGSNTGGSSGGGGGGAAPGIITEGINSNEIKLEEKFSDMKGFDWATEAVSYLESRGIVNGVGEGEYKPANPVTREQFIKMVVLLLGIFDEEAECDFVDCSETDWSYKYIASAKNAGITSGITEDLFGKEDNITREQAAVFIYRAISSDFAEEISESTFADEADISEYAKEAVGALKNAEIINGKGDGRFAPLEKMNRAEAAVIIYRLAKMEE